MDETNKYTLQELSNLRRGDAVYIHSVRYLVDRYDFRSLGGPRVWLTHPTNGNLGFKVSPELIKRVSRIVPAARVRASHKHTYLAAKRA